MTPSSSPAINKRPIFAMAVGANSGIDDGRLHQDSKTCAKVSPASLNRFQM